MINLQFNNKVSMVLKILDSGKMVNAVNYNEAVEQIRSTSFDKRSSVQEFMDATADAVKLHSGAIVSSYNCEEFIRDLVANGYLLLAE